MSIKIHRELGLRLGCGCRVERLPATAGMHAYMDVGKEREQEAEVLASWRFTIDKSGLP